MFGWSTVQLITTIYILVFVREDVNEEEKAPDEVEIEPHLSNIMPIFVEMVQNRNLLEFVAFTIISSAGSAIPRNIFEVYLTNDLGMPTESLNLMSVFFTPMNIVLAFTSSFFVAQMPFRALRLAYLVEIIVSVYAVFVIAGMFPEKEQITSYTILHVGCYFLIRDLLSTFQQVTTFAFILSVADKRISGIHVTFMACMTNLTYLFH